MKRTTVFFDEATMARLQREAQRGGVSAASLVREAVAVYLATPTVGTPMPSIAGEFSSGITDTSQRVDALLWKEPHG